MYKINNKVLLDSSKNYDQYSANHSEKDYVNIWISKQLCYTPETNVQNIVNQLYFN